LWSRLGTRSISTAPISTTLATLFVAQAICVELSFGQQITILIAAVFVSWWEGELDKETMHARLNQDIDPSDVETAITTG